jgi:hypothetical protein
MQVYKRINMKTYIITVIVVIVVSLGLNTLKAKGDAFTQAQVATLGIVHD